jgi:drug/metabolite transporter (DMT)-like permease
MPTLCMLLTTLLWGASYIFIKIALQAMHPSAFIFFRFLIASLCFLPVLAFYKPKFKRLDMIRGATLGLLLVGINFFQTIGMQTISASVSAFLTGTSIVFVLVIKFMVQKKLPRLLDVSMVLVCVVGLALVTGSAGVTWGVGVLYTLICAFFAALHTYVLSDYASKSNVLVLTLCQLVTLPVIAVVYAGALDGDLRMPTSPIIWSTVVLCAVFCTTVAFGMQTYAQKHLTAFKAAIILTLEPVFTTFFARVTLDEILRPQFYLGAFMILGAIILMTVRLERI